MATIPPQGAQPAQPGSPQSNMQQQLSPQQLQQMQLVVKQCMRLLLQDQTADMIVAKAKQGQPAQVLAEIVGPLLTQVAQSAKGAGANMSMVTLMVAGVQVFGLLAEMLFQADVIPSEQEAAQVVAQASKIAVDQHNTRVQSGGAGSGQPAQPAPGGAAQPPAGGGMMMQGA